jgi:hypothetical protein
VRFVDVVAFAGARLTKRTPEVRYVDGRRRGVRDVDEMHTIEGA